MTTSAERVQQAIGNFVPQQGGAGLSIGTVTAVNDDGSYQVLTGNASSRATCACTAGVGDRVTVLECSGLRVAVGRIGGGYDSVIEEGTSDFWTYRKWASGIAECWGYYSTTVTQSSRVNKAFSLPSGLFVSGSSPTITASAGISGNITAQLNYINATDTTVDAYIYSSGGSGTANAWIYCDVKGRWK